MSQVKRVAFGFRGLKIGIAAIARFVAFAFFSALRFHSVTDRGYAGF